MTCPGKAHSSRGDAALKRQSRLIERHKTCMRGKTKREKRAVTRGSDTAAHQVVPAVAPTPPPPASPIPPADSGDSHTWRSATSPSSGGPPPSHRRSGCISRFGGLPTGAVAVTAPLPPPSPDVSQSFNASLMRRQSQCVLNSTVAAPIATPPVAPAACADRAGWAHPLARPPPRLPACVAARTAAAAAPHGTGVAVRRRCRRQRWWQPTWHRRCRCGECPSLWDSCRVHHERPWRPTG